MSSTDMSYLLANKKWLKAKSILGYCYAGLNAFIILAITSLLVSSSPGTWRNAIKDIEGLKDVNNSDLIAILGIINSLFIAIIVFSILSVAYHYYTGVQFNKIYDHTLKITDKKSKKETEEAVAASLDYFKTVGWINLASLAVGTILVVWLAVSIISIASQYFR